MPNDLKVIKSEGESDSAHHAIATKSPQSESGYKDSSGKIRTN